MRSLVLLMLFAVVSCQRAKVEKEALTAGDMHELNSRLIEISREDIYNPPVASRVFAYPNLAAYEVYSHKNNFSPINNVVGNVISNINVDSVGIDYSVAAAKAYTIIAKKMIFSEHLADSMEVYLNQRMIAIPKDIKDKSEAYGISVAKQMATWIDKDNYAKVKSDDFYTIKKADSSWVLTPPTFDSALEPNWNKLRPIAIPNLKDFDPPSRPAFSKEKNSDFYKNALLVVAENKGDSTKKAIALHWDDNPNEYNNTGHNTFFIHKVSPPAHWINITKIISKNNKADFGKTTEAYAKVTCAVFDAIIACWNTKFTHELIRPVTYINRYIDPHWEPLIQTPPFPEYTSGHSNISGASSFILNELFSNTAFEDDTEVEFNLPVRKYSNVLEAGMEASTSRLYGGIHYKFGVDNGFIQGQKIGKYVHEKFSTIR